MCKVCKRGIKLKVVSLFDGIVGAKQAPTNLNF
jgi:hypothetical protein